MKALMFGTTILFLTTLISACLVQAQRGDPNKTLLKRLHRLEKIVDAKDQKIEAARRSSKTFIDKFDAFVARFLSKNGRLPNKEEILKQTKESKPKVCVYLDNNKFGSPDSACYDFPALNFSSYKTSFEVWIDWGKDKQLVQRSTTYIEYQGSAEVVEEKTYKKE